MKFLLLILALPLVMRDCGSAYGAVLLHSRPGSPHTLYLDFDGDVTPQWGTYSPGVTPAYAGDARAVWAVVADKYSPFNVDVTTVDPGTRTARVVVGGDGAWAPGVGGISYVGSDANKLLPAGGYVFPSRIGDTAHNVGEATVHEAGHQLGLYHQSTYDAAGNRVNLYNPGTADKAPVMGNSYFAARGLWWDGPNEIFAGAIQDDVGLLTKALGTAPDGPGVIETLADVDTYPVTGPATFAATSGGMLDLKLEVWDQTGRLVQTVDTAALGETVSLPAGQWSVGVESRGDYGDLGSYAMAVAPVGEPGTALLVAGGLMILGRRSRRRPNPALSLPDDRRRHRAVEEERVAPQHSPAHRVKLAIDETGEIESGGERDRGDVMQGWLALIKWYRDDLRADQTYARDRRTSTPEDVDVVPLSVRFKEHSHIGRHVG